VKRLGLAVFFLSNVAMAQAHLRAGVGGEIGPAFESWTWDRSYFGFMTGPTGKIGVDFRLGPRWVGAVYFDGAIQFYFPFENGRKSGAIVWNNVAFELRKHKFLFAAGPGFAFFCPFDTCQGVSGPGPALLGRVGYELVAGAHNAMSINLNVHMLFQGPPPGVFSGLNFWFVPAFMIGWEHQ
jgi:hypothetical protein